MYSGGNMNLLKPKNKFVLERERERERERGVARIFIDSLTGVRLHPDDSDE
jgi:hypothetical protein